MKHKFLLLMVCLLLLAIFHLGFLYLHNHNVESSSSRIRIRTKRLPQCILIGVRKGGTRALLDMLNLHTSIRVANFEVHFFDNDTNYNKGLDWYREQMPLTNPWEIALEKRWDSLILQKYKSVLSDRFSKLRQTKSNSNNLFAYLTFFL